jgi:hypothetical protein
VVPGFEAETWFGLYGPANLPPAMAAQHAAAAIEAIRDPALTERLAGLGAEVRGGTAPRSPPRPGRAGKVDAAGARAGHQAGRLRRPRPSPGA